MHNIKLTENKIGPVFFSGRIPALTWQSAFAISQALLLFFFSFLWLTNNPILPHGNHLQPISDILNWILNILSIVIIIVIINTPRTEFVPMEKELIRYLKFFWGTKKIMFSARYEEIRMIRFFKVQGILGGNTVMIKTYKGKMTATDYLTIPELTAFMNYLIANVPSVREKIINDLGLEMWNENVLKPNLDT